MLAEPNQDFPCGGTSVTRYDLYSYEPNHVVITGWHKFEADDDPTAIAIAKGLPLLGNIELWSQSRVIERWRAD